MLCAMYNILKDLGSFFAGLLALVAGVLAYIAGRAQAKAVEKQNEELKRAECSRVARSRIVAARMMDGVLTGIKEDINRETAYLDGSSADPLTRQLANAVWGRVRNPDLSTVWDQLGFLDQEIIKKYMHVERTIYKNAHPDFTAPTIEHKRTMLVELRGLETIVSTLQGLLQKELDARASD